jgi:putative DNA primase/helicase
MDSVLCNPFDQGENSATDLPPEYSEDALARQFTEQYQSTFRYTAQWSRWSRWEGFRWKRDTTLSVYDRARAICRKAASRCENERLSQRLASAQTVAAIERLARADQVHAMTPQQWDGDSWALNTPRGIVDLRTGRLGPSRPLAYCSMMTAAGPGGTCPRWLAFLDRVTSGDEALQAFIQRMCGYALTGETSEHALFFLYGTGANGKSVFLSTISGVMGDYARTAPIDTFVERRLSSHPTELASLQGARLVTAVETEEGRRWNESRIKTLTGGDRISARYMRGDFFEFTPAFKLMIAGNHRPALRTVDEAMQRRFRMLPFTTTIPEAERDPKLAEDLRKEWPGILKWVIAGCVEWYASGLRTPSTVAEASKAYLQAEDTLQQWIDDRCELRPSAWTATATLFADWHKFSETAGEVPGSQKRFTEKLGNRGFQVQRTMTARGFAGISLRELPWHI